MAFSAMAPAPKRRRGRFNNRVYVEHEEEDRTDAADAATGAAPAAAVVVAPVAATAAAATVTAAAPMAATAAVATVVSVSAPVPMRRVPFAPSIDQWFRVRHSAKVGSVLIVCGPAGCGKFWAVREAARRHGLTCDRPDQTGLDTLRGVVRFLQLQDKGQGSLTAFFRGTTRLPCWVFFGVEASQNDGGEGGSNERDARDLLDLAHRGALPALVVFVINEFPLHLRTWRTSKDLTVVTVSALAPDLRCETMQAELDARIRAYEQARQRSVVVAAMQQTQIVNLLCCTGMDAAQAVQVAQRGLLHSRGGADFWRLPVATVPVIGRRLCFSVEVGGGQAAAVACACGFVGGPLHGAVCRLMRQPPAVAVTYSAELGKSMVVMEDRAQWPSSALAVVDLFHRLSLLRKEFRDKCVRQHGRGVHDGILSPSDAADVTAHLLDPSTSLLPPLPSVVFQPLPVLGTALHGWVCEDVVRLLPPSPSRLQQSLLDGRLQVLTKCLPTLPDAVYWLLKMDKTKREASSSGTDAAVALTATEFVLVEHVLSLFPGVAAQGFWAQLPQFLPVVKVGAMRCNAILQYCNAIMPRVIFGNRWTRLHGPWTFDQE